jgi:hypothetical protein
MQLGGEQRKCRFEKMMPPLFQPCTTVKGFVALAPVKATEATMHKLISAYKPTVSAGWDLSRGFHKPTTSWFPAGSLFSEQINNSCIPIAL